MIDWLKYAVLSRFRWRVSVLYVQVGSRSVKQPTNKWVNILRSVVFTLAYILSFLGKKIMSFLAVYVYCTVYSSFGYPPANVETKRLQRAPHIIFLNWTLLFWMPCITIVNCWSKTKRLFNTHINKNLNQYWNKHRYSRLALLLIIKKRGVFFFK